MDVKSNIAHISIIHKWAVYLPEVDTVCYVSKSMIEENTKSFRIRKTEGKTTINIDRKAAPLYTNIINEAVLW